MPIVLRFLLSGSISTLIEWERMIKVEIKNKNFIFINSNENI